MTAAELEKLLAEVTPGPWEAWPGHEQKNGQRYWQIQNEYDAIVQNQFCWAQGSHGANARLIAMAPTLARKVIAAEKLAEALRIAKDRLEVCFVRCDRCGDEMEPIGADAAADVQDALAAWKAAQ